MTIETIPVWMKELDQEDVSFIKNLLLSSGSLKEVASLYGVTYPTVRLRLDRLIDKIIVNESTLEEPYVGIVKRMVIENKLDIEVARILINEYRNQSNQ